MSISVELADELVGRSDGCERRRRCRDAPKAFIDQDRRAALQFDNRNSRKCYGSNKSRAPECYGCNSMRVN
jgi:hypothetical protein